MNPLTSPFTWGFILSALLVVVTESIYEGQYELHKSAEHAFGMLLIGGFVGVSGTIIAAAYTHWGMVGLFAAMPASVAALLTVWKIVPATREAGKRLRLSAPEEP